MTARFIVGDTRDVTATLPDASVDLVLTSPPFLALRSYLPADHPDKHREIGSEANPAAFLDVLFGLTAEWGRVLAPHGSICVELGDTYAGSTADGGDNRGNDRYPNGRSFVEGQRNRSAGWPLDKSLTLIPELYRVGLAYGLNPLTGQEHGAGKWRVRNVVRWHRPNPPVGALGDKFRPATTDLVIACRARDRYFDLDAVREPEKVPEAATEAGARTNRKDYVSADGYGIPAGKPMMSNPMGAPPLDTWVIPTAAYAGAHYATWPPALCVKPIKAMCPERVCTVCGQPSRRIVETSRPIAADDSSRVKNANGERPGPNRMDRPPEVGWEVDRATLGWTDCGHDTWRPGVVFDPFAGTGTTLMVATGHGRDAIGIDVDSRNVALARERLGMFLEVEDRPLVP